MQWSFGVTVWEIFSGGKEPYPNVDPFGLMELLQSGETLSAPANAACTDEMLVSFPHSHLVYTCSYNNCKHMKLKRAGNII